MPRPRQTDSSLFASSEATLPAGTSSAMSSLPALSNTIPIWVPSTTPGAGQLILDEPSQAAVDIAARMLDERKLKGLKRCNCPILIALCQRQNIVLPEKATKADLCNLLLGQANGSTSVRSRSSR